nr:unnamed protein product [Spirometra erinaceieuropaei]
MLLKLSPEPLQAVDRQYVWLTMQLGAKRLPRRPRVSVVSLRLIYRTFASFSSSSSSSSASSPEPGAKTELARQDRAQWLIDLNSSSAPSTHAWSSHKEWERHRGHLKKEPLQPDFSACEED